MTNLREIIDACLMERNSRGSGLMIVPHRTLSAIRREVMSSPQLMAYELERWAERDLWQLAGRQP